jgi:hypothetical protein
MLSMQCMKVMHFQEPEVRDAVAFVLDSMSRGLRRTIKKAQCSSSTSLLDRVIGKRLDEYAVRWRSCTSRFHLCVHV